MDNILSMVVNTGTEPCNVNVGMLHETLLKLPAEKYIELYRLMQEKMEKNLESNALQMQCRISGTPLSEALRIVGYSDFEISEILGGEGK
jgi:hypothetical protein